MFAASMTSGDFEYRHLKNTAMILRNVWFGGVVLNSGKLWAVDNSLIQATRRFTICSALRCSKGLLASPSSSASAKARDSMSNLVSSSLNSNIPFFNFKQNVIASMYAIWMLKGNARRGFVQMGTMSRVLTGAMSSCTPRPVTSDKTWNAFCVASRTFLFICERSPTSCPQSLMVMLLPFSKSSLDIGLWH